MEQQAQLELDQQELEQERRNMEQVYQATLQDRIAELEAQNVSLTMSAKSAKRAARKRARRAAAEADESRVVHASRSCEVSDSDVRDQVDLIQRMGPGMSPAIDAQLAAHEFAQRALDFAQATDAIEVNSVSTSTPRSASEGAQNSNAHNREGAENPEGAPNPNTISFIPPDTNRQATSITSLLEEDYAGPSPSEVVREGDRLIDRFIGAQAAEQMLQENADLHDERVCRLISSGYNPREACEALSMTKVGGFESTARATEYLRVKSGTPLANIAKAVGTCQQQIGLLSSAAASATTQATSKAEMVFGPSLSEFVSANERAEGVAGRVQNLHDKSTFGHLSSVSKAAINLKEVVRRGPDRELRDTQWLGAICLAVCEDCSKCAANRAKKESRDAADRERLLQDASERGGRAAKDDWKASDSKHDRNLPFEECWICMAKPEAERNTEDQWCHHCDQCGAAAHVGCERLQEWVEDNGKSRFYCKLCTRQKQAAANALTRRDQDRKGQPPHRDWSNSRYVGGGAAAHRGAGGMPPPATPPRQQATPPRSPSGWDSRQEELALFVRELVDARVDAGTRSNTEPILRLNTTTDTVDNSKFSTSSSNTNVKINNYVMWEETGTGRPKQGTETGSGATAWAWFKRTNIPIRDAAVNMKGGLGLLSANAISHTMQITLAAGMLNEAEVQPKTNMSEREIDLWVQGDREFTWFKKLSDEILIKVMDRLSSSVNPAPFFRMAIGTEIPAFKDGDLYYPVTEFTNHADKWVSTLSELIKGGWKEGSTNLKQVFLASISSCQLVYDQAKREMHEDVLRLIATLKKWIIVQDNEIQGAKAAKASIKNRTRTTESQQPQEADKSFEKRVRALFTSMQSGQAPIAPGQAAGQDKTHTGPMWQCQHCGNEWRDDPAKPPRCKKECVYHEHKDFNKTEKYPKGSKPLSWKAYGEPYPQKQQAFFDKRDQQKGYSMNLKPEGRRK
jgi:hypothetical protein